MKMQSMSIISAFYQSQNIIHTMYDIISIHQIVLRLQKSVGQPSICRLNEENDVVDYDGKYLKLI